MEEEKENIGNEEGWKFNTEKSAIKNHFIDMSFLSSIESESLTPDSGVQKYSIQKCKPLEGIPPITESATVKIKYEGRRENGELLDIKRDINQTKNVKLGKKEFILGIEIAINSMYKGDIAWYRLTPSYHYYTNYENSIVEETALVKSDEILFYKIEVIDYENTYGVLAPDDIDTRMTILAECQIRGNDYFRQGDITKAKKQYTKGVNILSQLPKVIKENMSTEVSEKFNNYKGILNSNAAAAFLKENNVKEALVHAKRAFESNSSNFKFQFRLSCCLMENQLYQDSLTHLNALLNIEPSNKEVITKIAECRSRFNKKENVESKMWQHALKNLAVEEEKERKAQIMRKKREEMEIRDSNIQKEIPKGKLNIEKLENGCILKENEIQELLKNNS